MKLTKEWIANKFTREEDENGEFWTKDLTDCGTLALMTDDTYGFLEVILFPYPEIRFQTTIQVENIYEAIKGEML